MKKNILLIPCFAIMISCGSEDVVDLQYREEGGNTSNYSMNIEDAKSILHDYLGKSVTKTSNNKEIVVECKVHEFSFNNIQTKSANREDEVVPVYEFITDIDEKQGFSLVVGDKRIGKVLAFVEYGSLADTLYNLPLKSFFNTIPDFVVSDITSYYDNINSKKPATRYMSIDYIEAELPTLWGQDAPYNDKCPPCTNTTNTKTGCVATAIAQLLAYHKLPSNLNWSEIIMEQRLTSTSKESVKNEVSTLMRQIGDKVQMRYGCSSSGVSADVALDLAKSALISYGMSIGTSFRFLSVFEVKESLKRKCPVFIQGFCDLGGHAWICDAWKMHKYDSGEQYQYLKMNWGWNGRSNGYYYVSETPITFNTDVCKFYYNFEMVAYMRKL